MRSRTAAVTLLAALLVSTPALAAEVIFIVRHAERETGEGDDGLSAAGKERAGRLAAMLRDVRITHILTSNLRRTAETAAPLARATGLTSVPIAIPGAGAGGVAPEKLQIQRTVQAVKDLPAAARVLIVGHSNTVPMLLEALGVAEVITIPATEFDNLFIVTTRATAAPTFARLRY
jgi:broad specificity phosphatase PhoE